MDTVRHTPKLEERLKAGHRNPFPSLQDFAERDHYTAVGDRPGHGLLKAVGGRSLVWAGHSLRFGPGDFKRWPISYEMSRPITVVAERLMGVYGNKDGLWNMLTANSRRRSRCACPEMLLKRGVQRLKAKAEAWSSVTQRKAIPTDPTWKHRSTCHYCGHCMNGCEIDSEVHLRQVRRFALAMRTGNLTLLSLSQR